MLTLTAITATAIAVGQPPEVRPVTLEGKIREVAAGPAGRPQAMLIDAEGARPLFALDPAFSKELRRLAGLKVRVHGTVGDPRAAAKDHVLVDRYEILEVNKGVVPRVGHLAVLRVGTDARLVFVDGDGRADLLPQGWGRRMQRHAGAKIWMVGLRDKDGSFRPQRFAILRPAAGRRARPR